MREVPNKRDKDKDEKPRCARLLLMRVAVRYIVIGMEPG